MPAFLALLAPTGLHLLCAPPLAALCRLRTHLSPMCCLFPKMCLQPRPRPWTPDSHDQMSHRHPCPAVPQAQQTQTVRTHHVSPEVAPSQDRNPDMVLTLSPTNSKVYLINVSPTYCPSPFLQPLSPTGCPPTTQVLPVSVPNSALLDLSAGTLEMHMCLSGTPPPQLETPQRPLGPCVSP